MIYIFVKRRRTLYGTYQLNNSFKYRSICYYRLLRDLTGVYATKTLKTEGC